MGIHNNFLEPKREDFLCNIEVMNPASVGKRHEAFVAYPAQYVKIGFTPFPRRPDIQKAEFINFQFVENANCINRVADVAVFTELNGLDEAFTCKLQARNDTCPNQKV